MACRSDFEASFPPLRANTLYDLAGLTQVLTWILPIQWVLCRLLYQWTSSAYIVRTPGAWVFDITMAIPNFDCSGSSRNGINPTHSVEWTTTKDKTTRILDFFPSFVTHSVMGGDIWETGVIGLNTVTQLDVSTTDFRSFVYLPNRELVSPSTQITNNFF